MQISEQHLPRTEYFALDRLRFFNLDDHVRADKHIVGARRDFRAGSNVTIVAKTNGRACVAFDQYGMLMSDQFCDALGRESDAIFVIFDFFRYTDLHDRRFLYLPQGAYISLAEEPIGMRLSSHALPGISILELMVVCQLSDLVSHVRE